MNGNEVNIYNLRRAAMVIKLADDMSRLTDEQIAARCVTLLILDKGNVNRWNETLHLVLDAHTLMHRTKAEQALKEATDADKS